MFIISDAGNMTTADSNVLRAVHQFHFLNFTVVCSLFPSAAVTQDGDGPVVYLKSYPEEDTLLYDLAPLNANSPQNGGATQSPQCQHTLPQ